MEIRDEDSAIVTAAMRDLLANPSRPSSIGKGAIDEWLRDKNAATRVGAVEVLTIENADSPLVQKAVLAGLGDAMEAYPYVAAAGRLRLAEAVPRLAEIALDPDAQCRRAAVEALREIGDRADNAAPALQLRLRCSNDSGERASLAKALAAIGPNAAHAAGDLEAAIDDAEPYATVNILEALVRIDPSPERLTTVLAHYRKLLKAASVASKGGESRGAAVARAYRPIVAKSLQTLGERAAPLGAFVAEQLNADSPCLLAADALATLEAMQTCDADACDSLTEFAQNSSAASHYRSRAIRLVARGDQLGEQAKEGLLSLFADEDEEVRVAAIRTAAGAGLDASAVIPQLVTMLGSGQNNRTANAALASLISYGPRGADAAPETAQFMLTQNSTHALRALLAMGPAAKTAVPLVVEFVDHSAKQNKRTKTPMVAVDFLAAMATDSPEALSALRRCEVSRGNQQAFQRRLNLAARHVALREQDAADRLSE